MRFVVSALEALGGDVSVNLGRGEVGVTEKFLDAPQIGAGIKQVRGVAMPQLVRGQLRIEPGNLEVTLQPQLHDARRHRIRAMLIGEEDGHRA